MSDDIPVEIISTEDREDGTHVIAKMPGETGVIPESEHDSDLIEEARLPRDTPTALKGRNIARMFQEYPKVVTHHGPSRDRSLRGKARRKARKAG